MTTKFFSATATIGASFIVIAALAGCSSNSNSASSTTTSSAAADSTSPAAKWLTAVHEDDLAEQQAGALAQKTGSTQPVRDTGAMLVSDHALIDAGITMLAKQHNVPLPTQLNDTLTAEMTKLNGLQGAAFDKEFVTFFIAGHQGAVKATQGEITTADQPADVVAYAKVVLPVIQRHLNDLEMDNTAH
ncbi:DUF4142 domain-containing protein [Nocardia sp. NPDC088792]|uniref:DUF4142 domain-containing protein n=1 Tax=Nocardia sp. NPDC088792 TaxID=3364332 RepID=UPI00382A791E